MLGLKRPAGCRSATRDASAGCIATAASSSPAACTSSRTSRASAHMLFTSASHTPAAASVREERTTCRGQVVRIFGSSVVDRRTGHDNVSDSVQGHLFYAHNASVDPSSSSSSSSSIDSGLGDTARAFTDATLKGNPTDDAPDEGISSTYATLSDNASDDASDEEVSSTDATLSENSSDDASDERVSSSSSSSALAPGLSAASSAGQPAASRSSQLAGGSRGAPSTQLIQPNSTNYSWGDKRTGRARSKSRTAHASCRTGGTLCATCRPEAWVCVRQREDGQLRTEVYSSSFPIDDDLWALLEEIPDDAMWDEVQGLPTLLTHADDTLTFDDFLGTDAHWIHRSGPWVSYQVHISDGALGRHEEDVQWPNEVKCGLRQKRNVASFDELVKWLADAQPHLVNQHARNLVAKAVRENWARPVHSCWMRLCRVHGPHALKAIGLTRDCVQGMYDESMG